jgi:hypothetical protein
VTPDEHRRALSSLGDQGFRNFRSSWGGTAETVDACVEEYAYAEDPERWDRIAVFRLRAVGIADVYTEQEKAYRLTKESAEAAKQSASAAAQSAGSAQDSSRAAWYSVIAAVLTAFVTLAATRGC